MVAHSANAPMTDYPTQSSARLCAATGRALKPGEKYFGVLAFDGDRLVRRDFSPEGWTGPPAGAFGHWAGRVPANADASRRLPIDDEMLLECFRRLSGEPEAAQQQFRYVVSLLLMRRKRFRFEDVVKNDGGDTLILRDARTGERIEVADPGLNDEQMSSMERDVYQMLGWAES